MGLFKLFYHFIEAIQRSALFPGIKNLILRLGGTRIGNNVKIYKTRFLKPNFKNFEI